MKDIGFNFDHSYLGLPSTLYSRASPVKVSDPQLVIFNAQLATDLGLDFNTVSQDDMARLFCGNDMPDDAAPLAMAYAGHQFGHFTILGDGRAHLIGAHITPDHKRIDIHLKGSGRTPYARNGDGRAALGPMLREYIISEAMHYLKIPTTRSLAVTMTGENVMRQEPLIGAILTRTASSHIRIGTFEYCAHQQDISLLKALLNYTIQRHYPELMDHKNRAISLIKAVIEKQSDLVAHWMRVGFIHGVMNTDNMTLCGETIDYGPCAFMDYYDPATVFSSIDRTGRYRYENQPFIAQWNIARLAEALLPLIDPDIPKAAKIANEIIDSFQDIYQQKWLTMMRAKLGLRAAYQDDPQLITDLLSWMADNHLDFTNCFRDLSQDHKPDGPKYKCRKFNDWYAKWENRLEGELCLKAAKSLMKEVNPALIPRNHIVENILDMANIGNLEPLNDFLSALRSPYDAPTAKNDYYAPPLPSTRIYQTFCGT